MKHLARDIFKFLVIFLILFHLYPEYKYWTNKYKEEVNGGEVYQAIEKSKKRGKKKIRGKNPRKSKKTQKFQKKNSNFFGINLDLDSNCYNLKCKILFVQLYRETWSSLFEL